MTRLVLPLAFFALTAVGDVAAILPAAEPVAVATQHDEAAPLVRVTFHPESPRGDILPERTDDGRIVAELEGGSLLLQDRGGRLWPITPDRLVEREETGRPFTPYTQDEMGEALRKELGDRFEIVTTKHYVLATEAGRDYARWAGLLFERLMDAFENMWDRRPLNVHEPEFPLCAIILADRQRFREYGLNDAGPEVLDALGYYSTLTNRMVMFDLTESSRGNRPRNYLELSQRLVSQISNVSTIVHEATHQIAFNSGVHTRMADNPFWLVEGMAMFFETPDLKNAAGWRTVGKLNESRLRNYRDYLSRKPADSLQVMLSEDGRFHAANTALDAYAEAWALTYYLIRTRRDDYTKYLAAIAAKPALGKDDPQTRLDEFEAAFGPIAEVEKNFLRWIVRQRP